MTDNSSRRGSGSVAGAATALYGCLQVLRSGLIVLGMNHVKAAIYSSRLWNVREWTQCLPTLGGHQWRFTRR